MYLHSQTPNLTHEIKDSVILSSSLLTNITALKIATLIFFLVPLIEMVILIEVGGLIGALPTISLVILTAVAGIWLLRLEGIATLHRVQNKVARGEVPETELLEGIMLIFGGALLLTPGFATDAAGFICLLPGLRRPIASKIISSARFTSIITPRHASPFDGHTIDGDFDDETSERSNREIHHQDKDIY